MANYPKTPKDYLPTPNNLWQNLNYNTLGRYAGRSTEDLIEYFIHRAESQFNTDDFNAFMDKVAQLVQREEDYQRSRPQQQSRDFMSAGMSRAAALQALSPAVSVPADLGSPVTPTANALQNVSSIAQTVGGFVSVFTGLANNAASIKYTEQAAEALRINNNQSQLFASAAQGAANFTQGVQNYQSEGNAIPNNLAEMVQIFKDSDNPVYNALADEFDSNMSNQYFYKAVHDAYKMLFMDKTAIAHDFAISEADRALARINVESALQQLQKLSSEVRVQQDTEQAQIDKILSEANIAASQASMAENEAEIASLDADFWQQFDNEGNSFRWSYLGNMTQQQAYETALKKLNVDYTKQFNATECQELINRLNLAKKTGGDAYLQQVADNLLQSERVRANVLAVEQLMSQNAFETEVGTTAVDMFGFKAIADWFRVRGITGKAISLEHGIKSAVNFVAK